MTQNESLCTIYYADGRQEGPISTLVVRDLVQAGVLSPQDRVAAPGEQPVSVAQHPFFADLMRKGHSTGAVTAVKLGRRSGAEPSASDRRARNAARLARLTQPTGGGDRTLVTSGMQPAIQRSQQQAAIQRSQQQPAIQRSRQQAAIQRSQQQPAIQRSQQQAAIQRGASPSRPVLRGLGSPATNAAASGQGAAGALTLGAMYASSNKGEFFEKAIERGSVHMRDKLLMASLPDILGVHPDASRREMADACVARDARLRERYKGSRGGDDYLALIDSLKITHLTYNTLTEPARRQAYEKACLERERLVSFQNHLPVTLAMDPSESLPSIPDAIARQATPAVNSPLQVQPTASISTLSTMGSALRSVGGAGDARIGVSPPAGPSSGGLRRMSAPSSLDSGIGSDMEDSTALMSASDLAMAMTNVQVEINKPPEDPAEGLMLDSSDEDEEVVFEGGDPVDMMSGSAIVSEPTSDVEDIFKSLDGSKALKELPGGGDFAIDDMLKSLGGPALSRPPAPSPAPSPPALPQRPASTLSKEVAAAEPAPSPEFTIKELNQGAQALRDKLLMSNLPEVLGVDFGVPTVAITHTYELRRDQIRKEFPTTGFRLKEDDRLAAQDILNILESALEIMTNDEKRLEYQAASETRGRMLSFQNHVPFTFAFQEKEARKHAAANASSQGAASGLGAEGDGVRVSGQMSAIRGSGQMSAIRSSVEMPATRASGEMPAARTSGEMLAARISGQMPAVKPPESVYRKMKEEEERKKKREKEARKKEERRKQFMGAEYREKGDPFKGSLIFSIGRADRGLKHVLPVYITAFLLSFLMVSVGGMGEFELELRIGDPIIYARNGMLIMLALMGLMLLRRESILRFGLLPKLLPTLISLPFIGLLAVAASVVARFDINPGATMESLALLLALRAVAEGLFFYGYVTRTLLIEFKQPAVAILLSAFLYGIYALTYATLIDAKPFQTFYAVLIYTFGGGVPLAAIYWQTRSSIIIILAQFFILFMAAYGGLQYALQMN